MKYSIRIFLAIFLVTAAVFTLSGVLILRFVSFQAETEFIKRYQTFSNQIGDTFVQLDQTTNRIMTNALYVLSEEEKEKGLISNLELVKLRTELGVRTLFITDNKGRYVRSDYFVVVANDPKLKAVYGAKGPLTHSLFSYCSGYKRLISGGSTLETTPIIPTVKGWPFKFVMIPNHNRTRILQADMAMASIGNILKKAVEEDPGVSSIGLFTPLGVALGYVHSTVNQSGAPKPLRLENVYFGKPEKTPSSFIFLAKFPTATKDCIECRTMGLAAADGTYYYILRTEVSRKPLNVRLAAIRNWLFRAILFALALSALMAYFVSRRLVEKLVRMGEQVERIAQSKSLGQRLRMSGSDEVSVLANRFDGMMEQLESSQARLGTAEREKAFVELARQVAHDIRSPLAALETISKDVSSLPETHRVLVRSAVSRIRDIANSLLDKHRQTSLGAMSIVAADRPPSLCEEPATACLLSSLIDPLITEKRLQYRSLMGIEIDSRMDESSYGLFAKIQPVEFKRVLSNIINNAIEAIDGNKSGLVLVQLAVQGDHILVRVQDNGKGISSDILAKLGNRGESHGKAQGCGLGIHHAKTCVEAWGGRLEITSQIGEGTAVSLFLPSSPAPEWFVSELGLSPAESVVILDDDTSIHQLWRGRLDALRREGAAIETVHFSTPNEIRDWAAENSKRALNAVYLMDQELLGYAETGLSLAKELKIGERTILVTSRYEEPAILEECQRLKARMIPKGLAGLVPIRINQSAMQRWDAVLIDDDPLVRMTWSLAAAKAGKKLRSFSAAEEFFKEACRIDRRTIVYVDQELGHGVKGHEVSLRMYELGFREIYLATGHEDVSRFTANHLKGVTGKEPPWAEEMLAV